MRCTAAENDLSVAKMYGGVKLDEYNGRTCLETFLASVKNFASYYHWTPRDELFHLRASLKGPAGQLLWDLGTDVSLEKLVERLKQRFGGADQAERFRTELRIRRRQSGEELPTVYSDVHRLMSLAYPGHDQSQSMESVARDAFLEALDDPELCIHILEKGVRTMDEALRTAMSLEALDKLKDIRKKAWRSYDDLFADEPRRKKEKLSRFAVKAVETSAGDAVETDTSVVTVGQLQEALANCMKEMTAMRKEFAAAKSKPTQPNITEQRPNRPQYSQSAVGRTNNYSFRPRVPNGQVTMGYRGVGPRQPYFVPRGYADGNSAETIRAQWWCE